MLCALFASQLLLDQEYLLQSISIAIEPTQMITFYIYSLLLIKNT